MPPKKRLFILHQCFISLTHVFKNDYFFRECGKGGSVKGKVCCRIRSCFFHGRALRRAGGSSAVGQIVRKLTIFFTSRLDLDGLRGGDFAARSSFLRLRKHADLGVRGLAVLGFPGGPVLLSLSLDLLVERNKVRSLKHCHGELSNCEASANPDENHHRVPKVISGITPGINLLVSEGVRQVSAQSLGVPSVVAVVVSMGPLFRRRR